eukprot:PhF_6_TR40967/c0_g1_i1/m.62010
MAVCFSGQIRRHAITISSHMNNLIKPNHAHVYTASWVVPDDDYNIIALLNNGQYYIDKFHKWLIAYRVDFFHPKMFDRARFKRNTGAMFFLIEACTRLILGSGVEYDSIVRSRFDLTFHYRIVVNPHPTQPHGPFSVTLGGRTIEITNNRTFLAYRYTFHCINDWFAIGSMEAMTRYGIMYSIAQSNAVPFINVHGCLTEACISHLMRTVMGV